MDARILKDAEQPRGNGKVSQVDLATVKQAVASSGAGLNPDGTPASFGFDARADGLYLQQDLTEYSEFVTYLANEHHGAKLAIDIGVASGGQTKFLRDFFTIPESIIVDLGQHHEFRHWERIRPQVASKIIFEFIGDSHSRELHDALRPFAGKIDFAFIDGDHSFTGLMRDIMLVQELCVPGALFILHDTKAAPGCRKAFEKLCHNPDFQLLHHFDRKFGIAVFRCVRPAPRRPFWRHQLAGLIWRRLH
jgi:hypothetical protein